MNSRKRVLSAFERRGYPDDYLERCRIIGQDAIVLENLWTPIKRRQPDGSLVPWNDRSFKSREDLEHVVWPGEAEIEEKLRYIREYVSAARGAGIGVMFLCGCIFQTLYEFVIGLNDCMVMIVEEPELFDELMARSADYFAELVRRAADEGVDIMFLADDFAYNKGLFVEPTRFMRLWRHTSTSSSSPPAVPAHPSSSTPTARSTTRWRCFWKWASIASTPWTPRASTTATTSGATATGSTSSPNYPA